ncbi:BatA domain-containing protein [Candidatus Riflebacteria bacterium]
MGLSFLNPFYLLGLLAVSLPIVLHLFQHKTVKRILYPSLLLLFKAHQKKFQQVQLKQLLLLILRILLIISLALAFSKPLLTLSQNPLVSGSHIPMVVVIILDNSYSMSGKDEAGPLFEQGKSKALKILETLKSGDEAAIILSTVDSKDFSDTVISDISRLKSNLKKFKISYFSAALPETIEKAHRLLLASKMPRKELYLISDLLQSKIVQLKKSGILTELQKEVNYFSLQVGQRELNNVSIIAVQKTGGVTFKGRKSRIKIVFKNFSPQLMPIRAEVFLENKKINETTLELAPLAERNLFVELPTFQSGIFKGYCQLSGDEVPYDNRYYFQVEVFAKKKILFVSSLPISKFQIEPDFFCKIALKPLLEREPLLEVEYIYQDKLKEVEELDKYSAMVFLSVTYLPGSVIRKIHRAVANGLHLFISLSKETDPMYYNDVFVKSSPNDLPLLPATIGTTVGDASEKSLYYNINSFDRSHPIFLPFNSLPERESRKLFSRVRIYQYFKLNPLENSRVLAAVGEKPILVESHLGSGKVLLFGTSFEQSWNTFPYSSTFVPFLYQVLYFLLKEGNFLKESFALGESLPLSVFQEDVSHLSYQIPGKRKRSWVKIDAGQYFSSVFQKVSPIGPYMFYLNDDKGKLLLKRMAIYNFDGKDSDPKRTDQVNIKGFHSELNSLGKDELSQGESLKKKIISTRVGYQITLLFLWCVLLFFLLEFHYSSRIYV